MHRIERDEALIANLMALERQFWGHVQRCAPPPADGSDSADVALRALYPRDSGQSLDLSQDFEMSAAFSDLLAVRQVIATHNELEAQLKQRIQQRMGEASQALFEGWDVSWKRSKDSLVLDTARLMKEQPQLLEQYALARPGSRRFLINAA